MLRTVKFLSTFSCVSLRDMKETGAASRPVPPNHSDIRRAQVLQPPDSSSDILRGSSLIAEQSPASSQCPLTGTLVSYINTPVCVKVFFQKILPVFMEFLWFALVMLIGGALFLFACPKRNKKCTKGLAPTNASPQAGVHSHHTPGPPFTGDAILFPRQFHPAGKIRTG